MKKFSLSLCIALFTFNLSIAQVSDTTTVDIKGLFFSPSFHGLNTEPIVDSKLVVPRIKPIYKVAGLALSLLDGYEVRDGFLPLSPTRFTTSRPNTYLEYSYYLHRDYQSLNYHRNRFLNAPIRLD